MLNSFMAYVKNRLQKTTKPRPARTPMTVEQMYELINDLDRIFGDIGDITSPRERNASTTSLPPEREKSSRNTPRSSNS